MRKQHVILIDDDWMFLKALERQFVAAGWKVDAFTDLSEGFESGLVSSPDLVVVDYDLGMQGTGLDFLKCVKYVGAGSSLRVVVLTGQATVPKAVAAMHLGAKGFLAKPAKVDEIVAAAEGSYQIGEDRVVGFEELVSRAEAPGTTEAPGRS